MPNFFEVIKQTTSMPDLLTDLGIQHAGKGNISCISREHDDKNPSMQVNDNYLFCHGCGRRFSAIDTVMELLNLDLMQASRWLADWLGIDWPELDEKHQAEYEKEQSRQEVLQKLLKGWQAALVKNEKALEYLRRRGFTEEFIKTQGWGYCPDTKPADMEAAQDLGLVNEKGFFLPGERIIIPFFQYGKVAHLAFHKPGGEPKYLYPAGWTKPLISSVSSARCDDPAFLVEGVFCYFSLVQAGLPVVSALGINLSELHRKALKKYKDIVILYDNKIKNGENRGQEAAQKLLKELFPAVRNYVLREGIDVNDELKERGPEMFKAIIEKAGREAVNFLDLTMQEIKETPGDTTKIKTALEYIVKLETEVDRESYLTNLKELTKIGKTVLRNDLNRISRTADESTVQETEETHHDALLRIAQAAGLFKDEHDTPFARLPINGSLQSWPVRSRAFKMWLTGRYLAEAGRGPNTEPLNSAINTISALAWESERKHKLNVRITEHDGDFFYDLGDPGWRAVRIFPGGWEIVSQKDFPPLFRRYSHMKPQVDPVQGGDPWELLEFVNIPDEAGRLLYLVSIITDFVPDIPHTVKVIYGPGGATKTTTAKAGRDVVDPSSAPSCRSYRDFKEFMQYLCHNYSVILDNLSSISPQLSDLICSAVTGDGDSKRALYSDDDDIIYNFKRCFTINGINNVATRPDLLRRAVLFPLEPPAPGERLEEREYWKRFEEAKPRILGGIFDTLAEGMKLYPETRLTGLFDMADFTRWGAAISRALGKTEENFLEAYRKNKESQTEEAISNNAVASAIMQLMETRTEWRGTASALLEELEGIAGSERINTKAKGWPKAANSLSRKLNELKTTLQAAGVDVSRGKQDQKLIILEWTQKDKENIVQIVQTEESTTESSFPARRYSDDIKTMPSNADGNIENNEIPKYRPSDDTDGLDGFSTHSGMGRGEKNLDDDDAFLEVTI